MSSLLAGNETKRGKKRQLRKIEMEKSYNLEEELYWDDGYDGESTFDDDDYDPNELYESIMPSDEDDYNDDPCFHGCHYTCEHWGGDGICMLEVEELARQDQEYQEKYVTQTSCPVCQQALTQYAIPTDEIWHWPGNFYSPIIAVSIFCVLDVPKGVLHSQDNIHHIWIGEGEFRTEKLIHLMGKPQPDEILERKKTESSDDNEGYRREEEVEEPF